MHYATKARWISLTFKNILVMKRLRANRERLALPSLDTFKTKVLEKIYSLEIPSFKQEILKAQYTCHTHCPIQLSDTIDC